MRSLNTFRLSWPRCSRRRRVLERRSGSRLIPYHARCFLKVCQILRIWRKARVRQCPRLNKKDLSAVRLVGCRHHDKPVRTGEQRICQRLFKGKRNAIVVGLCKTLWEVLGQDRRGVGWRPRDAVLARYCREGDWLAVLEQDYVERDSLALIKGRR